MGRRCYLQSCAAHFVDDGQDPEGQADALLAAVLHQLKLTIRRHKADHLLGVEAPQVDTLVESHILHARQAGCGDTDFNQGQACYQYHYHYRYYYDYYYSRCKNFPNSLWRV